MKFKSMTFYTKKNSLPHLYFDKVDVIDFTDLGLVATANFAIDQEYYLHNLDFNKLKQAIISRDFSMSLESDDPFDQFKGKKVGIKLYDMQFIKSKRENNDITITVKLFIIYEKN